MKKFLCRGSRGHRWATCICVSVPGSRMAGTVRAAAVRAAAASTHRCSRVTDPGRRFQRRQQARIAVLGHGPGRRFQRRQQARFAVLARLERWLKRRQQACVAVLGPRFERWRQAAAASTGRCSRTAPDRGGSSGGSKHGSLFSHGSSGGSSGGGTHGSLFKGHGSSGGGSHGSLFKGHGSSGGSSGGSSRRLGRRIFPEPQTSLPRPSTTACS